MGSKNDNRDGEVYRVDTVPPPDGASDPYNAPTKVGPMAEQIVAEIILDAERRAAELRNKPATASSSPVAPPAPPAPPAMHPAPVPPAPPAPAAMQAAPVPRFDAHGLPGPQAQAAPPFNGAGWGEPSVTTAANVPIVVRALEVPAAAPSHRRLYVAMVILFVLLASAGSAFLYVQRHRH